MNDVVTMYFKENEGIPNHPTLPVLLYKGAWEDNPSETETRFNNNNWLNSWTNGVYDYHHYHSISHEVLGVVSGSVTLMVGGENGKMVELSAGDVVVLPAGTGHKRLKASPDFKIAGAYPDGKEKDLIKDGELPLSQAFENINGVPLPAKDPVFGIDGPLHTHWK